MQGKAPTTTKVVRKPSQKDTKLPLKKLTGVSGVDLLDRGNFFSAQVVRKLSKINKIFSSHT